MTLSLNPFSDPPGRFSLSPVTTLGNSHSSHIPFDQAGVSPASGLSVKMSWDLSPPPYLRLPEKLFDFEEEENKAASMERRVSVASRPSVEPSCPETPTTG